MLLTGSQLRALETLAARTATPQGADGAVDENACRILELDALASRDGDQGYSLTEAGRSAWQLVSEMRARGLLRPSDQLEPSWRFLGSEVLAALAAARRAGDHVGPLAEDLLRTRGLAELSRDRDRKITLLRLSSYGTAWLNLAQRTRPQLEITGDLANSMSGMLPAYEDPHSLRLPGEHAAQLEAMRLLVWSVPDRDVFTLTALGQAAYAALRMGGYHLADVVLDTAMMTQVATLAQQGAQALPPEQLARVQLLGYAGADGSLTPAGEAVLRARQVLDDQPAGHPATFTINRHEAELLSMVHQLAAKNQPTTKAALHKVFVDDLEKRYHAFAGKYGRKINEVPARKRQEQEMLAELRDRDRAFGNPAVLDEWLVYLESCELLRSEREGNLTVFRLTPYGLGVVQAQGDTPHAIGALGVKAVTITTMAGEFLAPAAAWIEQAREDELIGPGGITRSGYYYAWLAKHAKRWPALTREEARTLLNLPGAEEHGGERQQAAAGSGKGEGEGEADAPASTLDRLEARGLIERLVDGQIVRTAAGDLLERAVAGALELAHPITPAIVRLLVAVRQVGESLYVKEEKVRTPPRQWVEVERLTGLGPEEFQETVLLARRGNYLGKANLTEAGRDILEVMERTTRGA